MEIIKIGVGGSCHWCTEAIFQSLEGALKVEQGWIASIAPNTTFSEAVIVHYDPNILPLLHLIKVHLHTHSCTASHSLRQKYRSAVYTFSDEQAKETSNILRLLQKDFDLPLITEVLPFEAFRLNTDTYLDYYQKNPEKPFCQRYITPKLELIKTIH